jgi:hypothetical protein
MSCIHFAFLEQTSKDQLFHLQDEVIPSVSLQTPETPTLLQSRKFEPFKSGKKVPIRHSRSFWDRVGYDHLVILLAVPR